MDPVLGGGIAELRMGVYSSQQLSLKLILRGEGWCCCSCIVESEFKGEHMLVPHSPMCLRWPSTAAGSYVEKQNSSLF